jgi:chaperone required for assembly of F1-ATPase
MAGQAVADAARMKRFYEQVTVVEADGGFEIRLDGKPVRTPGKAPLLLPSRALADCVAAEWDVQGDKVDPRSMPLTGLANAAIDRIGPEQDAYVRGLAVYGETDLLCYRADTPEPLVRRQSEEWDPLLAWARGRYDADFEVVRGLMHKEQPPSTVDRLGKAVAARGAFALAGLSPLVTISGSLVIALALAEGAIDLETAWAAATLDERWQAEQWGEDAEAAKALANRRREFEAAYRFLQLL